MSLKALIIEDEPAAARRLQKMILQADPGIAIIGMLDSVSGAVRWLQTNPHPDMIFLDINLGDGISFAIFEKVEVSCPVIFTTAYDEYAIKAFTINSIDYLLKPIKQEQLDFSISKLKKYFLNNQSAEKQNLSALLETLATGGEKWKKRFLVSFGDKIKTIEVEEIAYFMILEKSTFLVTGNNDSYAINYSLEQLEELLDPSRFFRVNRKYIVSMGSIKNMWIYSRSRVKLQLSPLPPEDVIVSTDRSGAFKEWLNQ